MKRNSFDKRHSFHSYFCASRVVTYLRTWEVVCITFIPIYGFQLTQQLFTRAWKHLRGRCSHNSLEVNYICNTLMMRSLLIPLWCPIIEQAACLYLGTPGVTWGDATLSHIVRLYLSYILGQLSNISKVVDSRNRRFESSYDCSTSVSSICQ